jgi:hypothetical protein
MKNACRPLFVGIIAILLNLNVSMALAEQSHFEQRSQIEDLMGRYMFAMDFADEEVFAALFSKTGILEVGFGEIIGRDAIRNSLVKRSINMAKRDAEQYPDDRSITHRHLLTNIVIKINGDRAQARSYWSHISNNSADGSVVLISYGHYEDSFIKEDGQWLFSYRKIYNELNPKQAALEGNPAW